MIASTKRRGANVGRKYVGFADARDTLSRDGWWEIFGLQCRCTGLQ